LLSDPLPPAGYAARPYMAADSTQKGPTQQIGKIDRPYAANTDRAYAAYR
jgi:hypothetical protein